MNLSSIKAWCLDFAASHNSADPFKPTSQDDCGLLTAPFGRPPKWTVSNAGNLSATDAYARRASIDASDTQTSRIRRALPEACCLKLDSRL